MIETGLPVTNWVAEWREQGEPYTEEAINRVAEIKIKDKLTDRRSDGSGRFRPSMIGNPCPRAQVFSYLGYPQKDGVPEHEQMAHTGSELHYSWQEQGLSAGWLTDVEVEVDVPDWHLSGQMDGLCKDGSVFELKTMGAKKFWGEKEYPPVIKWEQPLDEWIRQVHAYMYARNTDKSSIVVLDRDSNAFREFRVEFDPVLWRQMDEFIRGMVYYAENKLLPMILPGCENTMQQLQEAASDPFAKKPSMRTKEAKRFNYCNYRDICGSAS